MAIAELKILGGGSIGNHMAHAARRLGWGVTLCDIDPAALARTQHEIYPSRYGSWDSSIRLCATADAPSGGADLIVIGTPPDTHIALARQAVAERPKAVLIEKPVCAPDLEGLEALAAEAEASNVRLFVGYDHVVGAAAEKATALLTSGAIGPALTIDVEFREEWSGIFAAHPWLEGPADSYLGYWRRGGGSTGEHSHALNFWQHLASLCGAGRIAKLSAAMTMVEDGRIAYDAVSAMTLVAETGLLGRVVQDVVTKPPRKWARVQGRDGAVEWICGAEPGLDITRLYTGKGEMEEFRFSKTRPDDFIRELQHIEGALASGSPSPIDADRGFETMLAIAAAYRSQAEGRTIVIDTARGWSLDALR
jgi:predicted dehydrogenase